MPVEQRYTAFEKAKNYTKKYTLDANDEFVTKQSEDGMLAYVSAGQLATTGSNIFIGGQIIDGNITITGDIYASNFVTSSTLLFTSSTNHGSSIGDTHTYTGSLKITGSLDIIGSTTTLGNTIISGGIFVSGGISGQINATNGIISSSTQIASLGFSSGSYETTGRGIVSSSTQIKNYGDFATTGSNNFVGVLVVTGSLLVSGSDTLTSIGNAIVTGSLLVSGSTTQIGNNTLDGNTILSGSFEVSGSTRIIGDTTIGNLDLSGSIRVSGSFTGSMQIDGDLNLQSPHSFYRWGNKLFNYGAFYDTRTQSGSLNVSQSIQFNSTDYSEGVSIVSGSRITLANIGVYNIQFSSQIVDTGAGDSTIHIWIKKNGQNVPNSAGRIFLQANKETIAAWNYVVPATSPNDYYELVWQSTDADARILAVTATGNIPAIPSIILTVTQVA